MLERLMAMEPAQRPVPQQVLSIDPGQTNVAMCFTDDEHNSTHTSKIALPEEIKLSALKFVYLEQVIEQWLRMFRPQFVVKEAPALGASHGVADAGRFQYIVERLCFEHGVALMTVQNSSMRKFIGASGGEHSKSDVKLRVWQKYEKEFDSEDECDAFAIGRVGLAILAGTYDVVKGTRKRVKRGA